MKIDFLARKKEKSEKYDLKYKGLTIQKLIGFCPLAQHFKMSL